MVEYEWTTIDGVGGYLVKSNTNGNSIFLPAAGRRKGSYGEHLNQIAAYWSSTAEDGKDDTAYYMDMYPQECDVYTSYRYFGRTIRPVTQ